MGGAGFAVGPAAWATIYPYHETQYRSRGCSDRRAHGGDHNRLLSSGLVGNLPHCLHKLGGRSDLFGLVGQPGVHLHLDPKRRKKTGDSRVALCFGYVAAGIFRVDGLFCRSLHARGAAFTKPRRVAVGACDLTRWRKASLANHYAARVTGFEPGTVDIELTTLHCDAGPPNPTASFALNLLLNQWWRVVVNYDVRRDFAVNAANAARAAWDPACDAQLARLYALSGDWAAFESAAPEIVRSVRALDWVNQEAYENQFPEPSAERRVELLPRVTFSIAVYPAGLLGFLRPEMTWETAIYR